MLWSLFNKEREERFDALTIEEARAVMMVLPVESRKNWMIIREDWAQWKPAPNCSELTSSAGLKKFPPHYLPPEPPELTSERIEISASEETGEIEVPAQLRPISSISRGGGKRKGEKNPRRYERFQVRWHVEIICDQQHFSSYTKDVSLGGIALEDAIPDWVAGYCTVVLSTPDLKRKLEFISTVVEDQAGNKYRLELHPSPFFNELKNWLNASMAA